MAGPLLHFIYPEQASSPARYREAGPRGAGTAVGHRILVLIETPETAALAGGDRGRAGGQPGRSELILSHLVAHQHDTRLEVGTGWAANCWT
jgi:hypothetical protein